MQKPLAVVRRDIVANTGPSIYGIKRHDAVLSPKGERFTFLGVSEGVAHVERVDKSKSRSWRSTAETSPAGRRLSRRGGWLS